MGEEFILQPGGLLIAGRMLQESIKTCLDRSEAAHFMGMFTEKRYILPMRNHSVCDIKRPTLHSPNHHPATFSRNETPGSAVGRRFTPVAIWEAGHFLRSIQTEVLLAQIVNVKSYFILRLLDCHNISVLHLAWRLTEHLFTDGMGILPGLVFLTEVLAAAHYVRS